MWIISVAELIELWITYNTSLILLRDAGRSWGKYIWGWAGKMDLPIDMVPESHYIFKCIYCHNWKYEYIILYTRSCLHKTFAIDFFCRYKSSVKRIVFSEAKDTVFLISWCISSTQNNFWYTFNIQWIFTKAFRMSRVP